MRNFREIHAENAHPHLQSGKIQIFYPKNMIVFMKNSFRLNIDYS